MRGDVLAEGFCAACISRSISTCAISVGGDNQLGNASGEVPNLPSPRLQPCTSAPNRLFPLEWLPPASPIVPLQGEMAAVRGSSARMQYRDILMRQCSVDT